MRLSVILPLLPFALAHKGKWPCLNADTAADFIGRFFAAWTASDASLVPALAANAVTEDFTYTDETLNFAVGPCIAPPEGPIAASLKDFVTLISLTIADADIYDEAFEVIDTVISCDKLAVRWQGTGKALGSGVRPNNTAKAGDPVRWKGTDIFHLDLSNPSHPLAKSSQSSSDWFWFTYWAGRKVVYQKYNFGACLCQDVDPSIGKDGQCIAPPPGAKFKV